MIQSLAEMTKIVLTDHLEGAKLSTTSLAGERQVYFVLSEFLSTAHPTIEGCTRHEKADPTPEKPQKLSCIRSLSNKVPSHASLELCPSGHAHQTSEFDISPLACCCHKQSSVNIFLPRYNVLACIGEKGGNGSSKGRFRKQRLVSHNCRASSAQVASRPSFS